MIVSALPPDVYTLLAALFLLLGVPAILFGLIMLYTGYVRYDAERYLEELEAEADELEHDGGPEVDTVREAESGAESVPGPTDDGRDVAADEREQPRDEESTTN